MLISKISVLAALVCDRHALAWTGKTTTTAPPATGGAVIRPRATTTTTSTPDCPFPTITSPVERALVIPEPTFRGTGPDPFSCDATISLYFYSTTDNINGQVGQRANTRSAAGSIYLAVLQTVDGTRENYGIAQTYTVADCAVAPTILTPTAGTVASTPVVTGIGPNTICSTFDYELANVRYSALVATSTVSMTVPATYIDATRFTVTLPSLAPGSYSLDAFASGTAGFIPNRQDITVTVAPANQSGGGGRRKRKLSCPAGQDACPRKSGLEDVECVYDLQSNIERCGACDGPDCTAIPNADTIACVDGACIIESCLAGYHLSDGQCKLSGLQIQE